MMRISRKLQNVNFKSPISILLNFAFFTLIFAFCLVREADAHNEYRLGENEAREAMDAGQHPQSVRQSTKGKSCRDLSENEMEALMERVISRKLRPVIGDLDKLRDSSEKSGFTEIVGGIGYIVGLMGVAMYLKSRRKADHAS